jgi:sporulation protein YunB
MSYRRRRVWKKKKTPRLARGLWFVLAAALSFCLIYLGYYTLNRNLRATISVIAAARAHQLATEAINRSLYETVLADVRYEELVLIHKDREEHVTMMQADSIRISRIAAEAGIEIKKALKKIEEENFSIPMGQFLGLDLLASRGPRLDVQVIPMGTVNVFTSEVFEQAGINQVKHTLCLNVETEIKVVIPLVQETVGVSTKIPIVENVIVGQVPDAYFSGLSGV